MQTPSVHQWNGALHIVKYLKGTLSHELFYPAKFDHNITGFCDADWARCPLTRRSISGHCVRLGQALISWKLKKQVTVA